jgi:hypothetical protein
MTRPCDQDLETKTSKANLNRPTSTEMIKTMRKRTDLMNLAGLCLSVAVMVAIALLAGWAAQAAAPAAFGLAADHPTADHR